MLKNLFITMTLKGLRRIDLAELSGVATWQIARCMKHPSLYKFKQEEKERLAAALEVSNERIDWLFSKNDEPVGDASDSNMLDCFTAKSER